MKSPARKEGGHDQVGDFVDVMSGHIVRVDDLVQVEQRRTVLVGEVGANLRSQNVIVITWRGVSLGSCRSG